MKSTSANSDMIETSACEINAVIRLASHISEFQRNPKRRGNGSSMAVPLFVAVLIRFAEVLTYISPANISANELGCLPDGRLRKLIVVNDKETRISRDDCHLFHIPPWRDREY
jgi:hypothetical protein